MKAWMIRSDTLPKALREMRHAAGLSQRGLSQRTGELPSHLKKLSPDQISAFECGRKNPTIASLWSFVVACSADGMTLDLSSLQRAIELEAAPADAPRDPLFDGLDALA